MSLLSRMYAHVAWADTRTLQSLRDMANPPSQAVDLFAHTLGAEHEWMCRILGRRSNHAIWPKINLERCATLAHENHDAYLKVVDDAVNGGGARLIKYRNSTGAEYTNTLEDILLHVAEHGVYHRGQVALLVRASGGNAISTDYILFTREFNDAT